MPHRGAWRRRREARPDALPIQPRRPRPADARQDGVRPTMATQPREGVPPGGPAGAGMTAMDDRRPQRIRIEQHSAIGLLWIAGWLFSIGYLKLAFWQGVLA